MEACHILSDQLVKILLGAAGYNCQMLAALRQLYNYSQHPVDKSRNTDLSATEEGQRIRFIYNS